MADVEVTCINKQPRNNPHEGITHLGGYNWWWTRADVIRSMKSGTNTFYTMKNGVKSYLQVVDGPNGEYVRTYANGQANDNLLALNECKVK
ncbi:MAG TPA: DUF3892 domain-containing protein [Alphaproteobacteria bacterium]|nr:DUF3892 domain-containing protein [Alphaproteobacteria bacterium]